MAFQIVDTLQETVVSMAAEDTLLVTADGVVAVNGDTVRGSAEGSYEISVLGTLLAANGHGIQITNGSVVELATGQAANLISHGISAVDLTGDTLWIQNAGTVQSTGNSGMELWLESTTDASLEFANSGTIQGLTAGLYVRARDGIASMLNSGEITGTDNGVEFYANTGTTNTLAFGNSGRIASTTQAAFYSDGAVNLVNSGEIVSTNGPSVQTDGETHLTNTGLLGGDVEFDYYPAIDDVLINSGRIDGSVSMGGGADLFDGRGGTVSGVVSGDAGDDTYIIDDAAVTLAEASNGGTDEVQTLVSYSLATHFENLTLLGADDIDGTGTEFQNVIIGNAGDNALFGDNSRDTIEGGAGNDAVDGGVGSDVLYGGAQDDWVAGRSGNDYLDGGEGDDFLFGGLGDDSMFGDEGNDTLKGGLGSDTMDGGAGADTFVFTRVADSLGGFSDLIENFEVGADILDFTGLVSGTLDVNILGGLTGGGQASLRTFENSYGDTIVFVDADGDGSSDMRIEVNMITGLTESDFAV